MKFESQLQIVTAAGVAPFTVNQTQVVINLNADLLDGQHGSYYQDAGNLNAGTVPSARLSGSYNIDILGRSGAVTVADSRSTVTTPQTINMGVVFDFKQNSTEALTDGGTYFGEMTFRQYGSSTDWTGGKSHQLGFTDNGNIWQRSGSNTTWGAWKKLLDSANFSDYALSINGGSVSGTLWIYTTSTSTGATPVFPFGISRQTSRSDALLFGVDGNADAVIAANDSALRLGKVVSGVFTAGATLTTPGNLGLGLVPSTAIFSASETRFVVKGNAANNAGVVAVQSAGTSNAVTGYFAAADGTNELSIGSLTNTPLKLHVNGTARFTLDTSGNAGLGITPQSWSIGQALQIGSTNGAALWAYTGAMHLGNNFNYSGGYNYSTDGSATRYTQTSGAHQWFTASSGIAGNPISVWTQGMALDASSNLTVAGSITGAAISGTTGTFSNRIYANNGIGIVGGLYQGVYTRRQIVLDGPSTASFGNWKQFIRLWPTTGSGGNLFTLKVSARGTWNYGQVYGTVEAYYTLFVVGDGTIGATRDFRIIHVSGPAADNVRLGDVVIENGYASIPVWAVNTNQIDVSIEQWNGSQILGSTTTAVSETLPAFIAPSFRGGLTSDGALTVNGTATFNGAVSITGGLDIVTSGSATSTSTLVLRRSGQAQINFDQFAGSWRSVFQIQSNANNRMLFFAPPDDSYQYGILRSVNGGLKIDVGGTTSNGGTNAVTIETSGAVTLANSLTGTSGSFSSTLSVTGALTYGQFAVNTFSVSVNNATFWTVTRPNGTALQANTVYRISMVTTGTGTDTGEQYLVANVDSLGWVVKTVAKTQTGTNQPYVVIDAGVPKVRTDHPSLYTITVMVEEFNTGNSGGLPSFFGLEGFFSSDNGAPKYRTGWYGADNTLLHSGNYNSYAPTLTGTGASGNWPINITGQIIRTAGVIADVQAPGSGTFNKHQIYANATEFAVEAALATDASNGTKLPIYLTWRGGYATQGGLKVTGVSSAELGGNVIVHAGNVSTYALPIGGGTVTGNLAVSGTLTVTGITYANGGFQSTSGQFTGPLLVNNDNGVRASYDNGGSYAWLYGYGVEFGRATSYVRPNTNRSATLLVGGPTINSLDWLNIDFFASGRFTINNNAILHAGTTSAPNLSIGGSATSLINGSRQLAVGAAGTWEAWRSYSATATATAIGLYGSSGTWYGMLYGDSSGTGFLNSSNGWDLQKAINGELSLTVSGTARIALHAGNYGSYALPITGGTLTGATKIKAGHSTTRLQLHYSYDGNDNSPNAGYLTLWASEPGIAYSNTGIGGNIHIDGQYYGRQGTGQPYGVYLHFDVGNGYAEFWNTTGTPGTVGGQGTRRAYIAQDGQIYATANAYKVLNEGNYSSYTLPLSGGTLTGALNSNSKIETTGNVIGGSFSGAGTGLTGTASSLSIGGNAATATSSPLLSALGNYVWSHSTLPTGFNQGIQASFVSNANGWQNYGSVVTVNTYFGGGGALQLYVPYSPTYGGTGLQVRFGNYDVSSGNSWTSWKTLLASDNYNSYVLSASGTASSLTAGSISDGAVSTTAKLANSIVTYAKIQNVSAYTILGNSSPSAAQAPVEISMASLASMLSGQTMNISGSSTSCSGNAVTATTATNIADGAVSTTAKLANSVVTYAKIQNVGVSSVLGNTSASVSQAPQEISFTTLNTNLSGAAKAWVTFSENPSTGAITVNASYGISSVTRVSAGVYTVNFSTAFSDTHYAVSGAIGFESNSSYLYAGYLGIPRIASPKATGSCMVTATYVDGLNYNARYVHVIFHR